MEIAITSEQVILIGFFAMLVSQIIKLLIASAGVVIDRKIITVILFILSVGMAAIWASPSIPPFPAQTADPSEYTGLIVAWIGSIVSLASVITGFATIIYNLLLQKVFDALGWNSKTIAGK